MAKLKKRFFLRDAERVAHDLLGKIIVRKTGDKVLKARIVEAEAYLDEKDPASWASLGKRKDNLFMWDEGGTILIKNVHKYLMLNFVTHSKQNPQAVLIRALEPMNFEGRCSGPGLLTMCLKIKRDFNGKKIYDNDSLWIEEPESKSDHEVHKSSRIGVKKDSEDEMRFYIKGNKHVSR